MLYSAIFSLFLSRQNLVVSIFAKRLFVLFAEPFYLKKLKALGYKTFDSIIDESYDDCEYPIERADHLVKSLQSAGQPQPSQHNRLQFQKIANSAYSRLINILQDINKDIKIKENLM